MCFDFQKLFPTHFVFLDYHIFKCNFCNSPTSPRGSETSSIGEIRVHNAFAWLRHTYLLHYNKHREPKSKFDTLNFRVIFVGWNNYCSKEARRVGFGLVIGESKPERYKSIWCFKLWEISSHTINIMTVINILV